ncbi:hypothetical protein [Streptomyces sp. V3I7]|uniref:hypothetical protein n=1 Tax=Streptomyces sp. V3I7 TaxID=3042278 RepID=UPI00277E9E27|nr:hypothetical protein [Streptomyces sp. V3I7]MDQ0993869.1 hypothetical protein [Streptomyces sp. V3I7]
MTSDEVAAGAAEFDVRAGLLGIDVPADLKDGVVRGYLGLRAMSELLRGVETGRTETSEGRETADG